MIRSTSAACKNRLSTKIVPDNTACPGTPTNFIYFEGAEKSGKMALWRAQDVGDARWHPQRELFDLVSLRFVT